MSELKELIGKSKAIKEIKKFIKKAHLQMQRRIKQD
jgi:hypothetical protein